MFSKRIQTWKGMKENVVARSFLERKCSQEKMFSREYVHKRKFASKKKFSTEHFFERKSSQKETFLKENLLKRILALKSF